MCLSTSLKERKYSVIPSMFPIYFSVKASLLCFCICGLQRKILYSSCMSNLNRAEYHCYKNVWCFLINRQGKHLLIINRDNLPGEWETHKSTVSPQAALHLFALWSAVTFSTVCQLWNRTISSVNWVTNPVK